MNILEQTELILSTVRKKTNKVVLFFSCGKDSLALLDLCSKEFDQVVCCFMYFVKDLQHINTYITWAENHYPNVKCIQYPHWMLTTILRGGVYCNPQPNIKILKLNDIDEAIRLKTGINWTIYGFKKADSMNRRLMLKTYDLEAINYATGKMYPLSGWLDKEVLRYLEINRLPAPINYEGKKRSNGVGFDLDVFLFLRKYWPGDLQKILVQFPQSGRLLFDHDRKSISKVYTFQK